MTPRQAEDNLNAVARQMTREHPTDDDGLTVRLVKPGLLGDTLGGPAQPFLAAIMALALLVLVAACVNLAGIFAARAADRSRELAIRLSIGSTRWRILRQLLTEAVLISVVGGAAGTMLATHDAQSAQSLAANQRISNSRHRYCRQSHLLDRRAAVDSPLEFSPAFCPRARYGGPTPLTL